MSKTNDELDESIRHLSILIETVVDQNKAVLEAVGDMQTKVALLPTMQEDIAVLKDDMKVVKAAVTATNQEVRSLDHRVIRLEAAT